MTRPAAGLLFGLLLATAACSEEQAKERPFDCAAIADAPLEINQIEEGGPTVRPAGHHDLAFDRDGWIAGHNGNALVRASRDLRREVLSTAIGSAEGMEYLSDGSLVVAARNDQGIVSISPDGALVPLAPDRTDAFSIVAGPDGLIYSGDFSGGDLVRVDPRTGAQERYLNSIPGARVLAFSPDRSRLYVGTFGEEVWVVDLDRDLEPVGEPRRFVTLPNGPYVDGLAVDVCGNLYIPVYPDSLYRITPDGTLSTYHHWADTAKYGHGLKWGSGVGGWRRDALYMPQPWNGDEKTVVEVVVGVPGVLPGPDSRDDAGDPHELTCAASGRRTRPPLAPLALLPLALLLRRRRLFPPFQPSTPPPSLPATCAHALEKSTSTGKSAC